MYKTWRIITQLFQGYLNLKKRGVIFNIFPLTLEVQNQNTVNLMYNEKLLNSDYQLVINISPSDASSVLFT